MSNTLSLLELPNELLLMILDSPTLEFLCDTRLTCKRIKELSEKNFQKHFRSITVILRHKESTERFTQILQSRLSSLIEDITFVIGYEPAEDGDSWHLDFKALNTQAVERIRITNNTNDQIRNFRSTDLTPAIPPNFLKTASPIFKDCVVVVDLKLHTPEYPKTKEECNSINRQFLMRNESILNLLPSLSAVRDLQLCTPDGLIYTENPRIIKNIRDLSGFLSGLNALSLRNLKLQECFIRPDALQSVLSCHQELSGLWIEEVRFICTGSLGMSKLFNAMRDDVKLASLTVTSCFVGWDELPFYQCQAAEVHTALQELISVYSVSKAVVCGKCNEC